MSGSQKTNLEPERGNMKEEIEYNPPPPNHGADPPFSVLSRLFERLQNERKYDRRRRMLEIWFKNYREQVGNDLYGVLRLIIPQKDRERAVYHVKEKNLAKLFIRAIPLGKNDPDAVHLLNWKKPAEEAKSTGDFPAVLYDVLSKRSSVTSTSLSISDVNKLLDDLAIAGGKMDKQMSGIQLLYNRCTPMDQRWIVRIVLKDLLISVKETTVFSVFHPDAQALFNTCSDLKRVAYELWDPSHSLNPEDKAVQLYQAFAPMLCKRPLQAIEDTVKKMGGSEFFIEEKLDGERMQLHKRGAEYFYCSRKGKDYTYLYGKHVGEGSLTPFIHKNAFHEDVEELILDGEMLVYDPSLNRYLPFGNLKTAALDKSGSKHDRPRPCFKIFDVLLINGRTLLEKSTESRRRNLHNTVNEIRGRIEFATSWRGRTAKDIRDRMEQIMAARGEGLVIKHPQAQYILNGRNEDWIKVKPEYLDNMGETVDVLVTGGNYGSGRRGGGVSTLICSVRDDSAGEDGAEDIKYRTFVRIGSGLSFTDYVNIRAKPWKPFDRKRPPPWLLSANKGLEDKGDVYLEPEDSFILTVKAAEITPSDQYHLSVTMRFPRALRIRDDLDISDCATASEIMDSLRKERKRKLEVSSDVSKKKRRVTVTPANRKMTTFAHRQAPSDINEIEVESDIFQGMRFHVLLEGKPTKPSLATERKHDLERLIVSHGGEFAAGYKHDPAIVIIYGGEAKTASVNMIIRAGDRNIIKPKWVEDCIRDRHLVTLSKRYFFHVSEARENDPDFEDGQSSESDTNQAASCISPNRMDVISKEPGNEDDGFNSALPSEKAPIAYNPPNSDTDPESATEDESDDAGDEDPEWADSDDGLDNSKPTTGAVKSESYNAQTAEVGQYDQDLIFKHLFFYLDTIQSAEANNLKVTKRTDSVSLSETEKRLRENGGEIVPLDDPRLTHVIFEPDDTSRRLQIRKRVCREAERYLIVAGWVDACLEEATLLDERMYDA